MKLRLNTNSLLLGGFALAILAGCGSNPSNCLSNAVISTWLSDNGYGTECPDPNANPPVNLCTWGGDVITTSTVTETACAYYNSSIGAPQDPNGCNVLCNVQFNIDDYLCTAPNGDVGDVYCTTGTIVYTPTTTPCIQSAPGDPTS